MNTTAHIFPNYLQLRARSRISARFWTWTRAFVVLATLAYVALLFTAPARGLFLFWQLTVPLLPMVFLIAPGLWRNACPMAASNQTPRLFGFSLSLTPPAWFREYGYVIGLASFVLLASSRKWLFNYDGPATAILMLVALCLAFGGGYLFKGKSGWCSSICPLYPVQRLYNQTPFVTLPNTHCTPCVGCTKNCYDFNPAVAYLADLHDDDRYYASYRKVYAAIMPGFIAAYFTLPDPTGLAGIALMYTQFALYMVLSLGLFFLADSFLKVSTNKITAIYAAVAFNLFYAFGLPRWLGAVASLWNISPPVWLSWIGQAVIFGVTAVWVARTYRKEPLFLGQLLQGEETRIASGAERLLKQTAKGAKAEVTFMPGEVRVLAEPGRSVLEIAEANNQKIEAGCRMGVCGADPVVVLAGMENLPPAGSDEAATLERLGLGANCRMACMSRANGAIAVSLNLKDAVAPAAPSQTQAYDSQIKSIVIIGNGIAGVTAADYVRRMHPDVEIHLAGREKHQLYNRMAITRLIYGRSAMNGLYLHPESWYEDRKITCWLNTHVARIDRQQKEVVLATGERLSYDRIILASGSSSFVPPIPGYGLPGTYVLREAEDAMQIRAFAQQKRARNAVVAGGGLLGLEAAYALHKMGLDVWVLERGPWLLRRQLDERAGHLLEEYLEKMGLSIITNAEADRVQGDERICEVMLKDGRSLPCEVFLVAAGVKPNIELARDAGLVVNQGVVVDQHMRTSAPEIFAAGDVAEYDRQLPGLWAVAVEQARIAANNAVGGQFDYSPIVPVTALKVVGVDVLSVGRFDAKSDSEFEIVLEDLDEHRYRKLVIADNRIVGAILIGHPQDGPAVTNAVKSGLNVDSCLNALRLGEWGVLAQGAAEAVRT